LASPSAVDIDNACQYDGNGQELFTCPWADLPVGGQKMVTISGILSTAQELVATVTVKSNEHDAVSTSYSITADQTVPPPSTIVTGGGNSTPTSTASGGGGGGTLEPLTLLLLTLATLARFSRRGPRCRPPSRGLV
jgi:hypothetical protein